MAALAPELAQHLRRGAVIPAHPLALNAERKLDEVHQRALTRYYCDAGVGGVAVGVHTTQFEIHAPESGLLEPVLALASEEVDAYLQETPQPFIKIAGLIGPTEQARREAELALAHGYHAGLLSLGALRQASDAELLQHVRQVAAVIPVVGFYLQPAVGGRVLSYRFWREFAEIENVVAIKVAPFNRYQTVDVVRGVAEAGRGDEIALYTGNDDNIVVDLLTDYAVAEYTPAGDVTAARAPDGDGPGPLDNTRDRGIQANGQVHDPRTNGGTQPALQPIRFAGGLLGQWAVWTRQAVKMLDAIQQERAEGRLNYAYWLRYSTQLTDANAAIFDAANGFRGCIAGIHWVLHRQGLMQSTHTLNPEEQLSPGQAEEIERVCAAYPHLTDDEFVAANRSKWLD